MSDYTYILYLTISHNPYNNEENETLFLGESDDPFNLYFFAFKTDNIEWSKIGILLEWLNLVETLCEDKKIKLTENRRIIARAISSSNNHPNIEEVYKKASKVNPKIGIAPGI